MGSVCRTLAPKGLRDSFEDYIYRNFHHRQAVAALRTQRERRPTRNAGSCKTCFEYAEKAVRSHIASDGRSQFVARDQRCRNAWTYSFIWSKAAQSPNHLEHKATSGWMYCKGPPVASTKLLRRQNARFQLIISEKILLRSMSAINLGQHTKLNEDATLKARDTRTAELNTDSCYPRNSIE